MAAAPTMLSSATSQENSTLEPTFVSVEEASRPGLSCTAGHLHLAPGHLATWTPGYLTSATRMVTLWLLLLGVLQV